LVPFYTALGWAVAPAGGIASAADIPLAMVRQPNLDGPDLIRGLQRDPVIVATAW
jgi:hypothetical protein